ncbi:hypothetical protein, partial [Streptomyces sp. NPDC005093]
MSIKNKVLAAAAMVTMVSGLGAAGTLSANAATPECGDSCIHPTAARTTPPPRSARPRRRSP